MSILSFHLFKPILCISFFILFPIHLLIICTYLSSYLYLSLFLYTFLLFYEQRKIIIFMRNCWIFNFSFFIRHVNISSLSEILSGSKECPFFTTISILSKILFLLLRSFLIFKYLRLCYSSSYTYYSNSYILILSPNLYSQLFSSIEVGVVVGLMRITNSCKKSLRVTNI